ncbi:MAG TPA: anti-phage deoxyguanosine triphosphatase [Alphaproteobacteria bacterium]|nr:anti-phage deoxyguanosine triphosphatase [Alphaproteobacteria bacterium]
MRDDPLWSARRSGRSQPRDIDHRAWDERDRARIIHASSFRRLQAKTQVLGIGEGDFFRTRLTHSMEAAQIGSGLVRALQAAHADRPEAALLPSPMLIEAICLAHDLGHPPFGHGGEVALNWCMRDHGGFEGNGQTLRLLARLEAHTAGFGLDLARRTLLGVLKYPSPYSVLAAPPGDAPFERQSAWKPPKCVHDEEAEVVEWVLDAVPPLDHLRFVETEVPPAKPGRPAHGRTRHKALDTSIMELADDIAYGVHDLEDAIASGFVTRDRLEVAVAEPLAALAGLPGAPDRADVARLFEDAHRRKWAIGKLVNFFIVSCRLEPVGLFETSLLDWNARMPEAPRALLRSLATIVMEEVIQRPAVQRLEFRGQALVRRLFEVLATDPERFLPREYRDDLAAARSESARLRVVCDYVSGMTDDHATRLYERFFVPRAGTAFDHI